MMSMQKTFLLDTSNGHIFGNQGTPQYKREKSLLTSFNPDKCRGYLMSFKMKRNSLKRLKGHPCQNLCCGTSQS